jgi:hypothetical protein
MGLQVIDNEIKAVPPGTWPDCFKTWSFSAYKEAKGDKEYADAIQSYQMFVEDCDTADHRLIYPCKQDKKTGKWALFFPTTAALSGAADVFVVREALWNSAGCTWSAAVGLANWLGGEGGAVESSDSWFTALGKLHPVYSVPEALFGSPRYLDPDLTLNKALISDKLVPPVTLVKLGAALLKLREDSPFVHAWVIRRAFGKALGKAISADANAEQAQRKVIIEAAAAAQQAGEAVKDVVKAAAKSALQTAGLASWIIGNAVPLAIVGGAWFLYASPAGIAWRKRTLGR